MFSALSVNPLKRFDLSLNAGLGAVTIIVFLLIHFVAFHPLDLQRREATRRLARMQSLIHRTSEISRKSQALEVELSEVRRLTAELDQRIPTSPHESDFLAQVCKLAGHTGIEVADYHPGNIEKRESHHEMEVKLTMRGQYGSLCKFLHQIDQVPRLCRLTKLEISTPVKGDVLSIEMSLRIYYAPVS